MLLKAHEKILKLSKTVKDPSPRRRCKRTVCMECTLVLDGDNVSDMRPLGELLSITLGAVCSRIRM
ncbi:hypothetical protein ARMSODRAFT_967585, partial [Armillaria solidipes]